MQKIKNEKNRVYGIHAVTALLMQSPEKIRILQISHHRHDERLSKIFELSEKNNIPIEKRSHIEEVVVAICIESDYSNKEIILSELLSCLETPPLLLILDGVQDPHNLGACLRTANAAGVNALIIPKDRAAPLNATAKKVASGAAEFTPVITVINLVRTLAYLKEKGVWIYGLAEDAEKSLYQENFKHPTAFVMGAEGEGLRRLTKENCDTLLSIPMMGQIESLNVSVATGVCLYEARRQRSLL